MLGKRGGYPYGKYSQQRKRAKAFPAIAANLGFKARRVRKPYGKGYQPTNATSTGPELKWWDHGQDLTSLDTAPSSTNPALYYVQSLNQMAAGDDGDQRNGNKIQAKKITIRMKVAVDPNSDSSNTNIVANAHTFRVLLVVDTQPSGAAPTWAQIVENSPNNEGQLYVYNKLSSTGRFKTLMDKFITVPPSYVVFDGDNFHAYGNNKFFKKSIPLDFAIHYSDTTNNFTGIQKNNIFMIIASDASLASYADMKFSYRARLRFHDF